MESCKFRKLLKQHNYQQQGASHIDLIKRKKSIQRGMKDQQTVYEMLFFYSKKTKWKFGVSVMAPTELSLDMN